MKPTILILALGLLACSPTATAITAHATTIESVAKPTLVTIVSFRNHGKTTAHNIPVEMTDNGLTVTYRGSAYRAVASDREGYNYMFSDGKFYWYFNYN